MGLSLALGSSLAMHQTSAIMPGAALRIEKDAFETLAAELPQLRAALLRHTHSLSLQISYLAFCNAKHPVEQRVPRWLSMACERLGGRDLPVTQDAIATLLGVRRPGVTDALQKLLKDGIIASSRGNIRVLDANELAARSCLCCRLIEDSEARFRMPLHSHVLPQKAE